MSQKIIQQLPKKNKLIDRVFMKNATLAQIQTEIESGADVNEKDMSREGWTPLIWASVGNPSQEIVIALIKHGAKVNNRNEIGRDGHGYTPLKFASKYNSNPQIAQILVQHGAIE